MRVVLAGQGALGCALLEGARAAGHEVIGVLADGREHPWQRIEAWTDPVRREARRCGIPVIAVRQAGARAAERIAPLRPEVLLVGDFGLIVRPELRAIAPQGAVNAHWSLLPRHRGPDPAAAAILAGDAETGLTFHWLTDAIDAGEVLDRVGFPIGRRDTAHRIYATAARLARERVAGVLERVAGGWEGDPQDPAAVTRHVRLDRDALRIRWTEPAARIDRLVRAASWPAAWFPVERGIVYLREVEPLRRTVPAAPGEVLDRDPLLVAAGEGALRIVRAFTWRGLPLPWPLWSPPTGARLR